MTEKEVNQSLGITLGFFIVLIAVDFLISVIFINFLFNSFFEQGMSRMEWRLTAQMTALEDRLRTEENKNFKNKELFLFICKDYPGCLREQERINK